MKRTIFITAILALLLLCSWVARGQNDTPYEPFRTGTVWSVNDFKFGSVGDTIIEGITYMKIYKQSEPQAFSFDVSRATYWGALRNDILKKQVYFAVLPGTEVYDAMNHLLYVTERDTDLLFYDFSLNLGDTVTCHFFEEDNRHVIRTEMCRVEYGSIYAGQIQIGGGAIQSVFLPFYDNDSIVSIGEDGGIRRMIVKGVTPVGETVLWIEGVGSSSGFLSQSDSYLSACGGANRLICYCNEEGDCLFTGFDISDYDSTDCFSIGFGSGIGEKERMQLSVYPSPTNGEIRISGDYSGKERGFLRIYDTMGKLCFNREVEIPSELDVSFLRDGLYILQFSTKNNSYSGKIIKQ